MIEKKKKLGLTGREWRRLDAMHERVAKLLKKKNALWRRTSYNDEHPEWYNGPCLCSLCMSYASKWEGGGA